MGVKNVSSGIYRSAVLQMLTDVYEGHFANFAEMKKKNKKKP
jgi:hypothetical protein